MKKIVLGNRKVGGQGEGMNALGHHRSTPPSGCTEQLESTAARFRREDLVQQVARRGPVHSGPVLDALRCVRRHLFLPGATMDQAYGDRAVPIGWGQMSCQPTMVGIMMEALDLTGTERVLEIGTGSGYQAAVLSFLAAEVYSVEIVPELAEQAATQLAQLGFWNVEVRMGDGYVGWLEKGPFDRIIATACPWTVPPALREQLVEGGILIIPVGIEDGDQQLLRCRKVDGHLQTESLCTVRCAPMVPDV